MRRITILLFTVGILFTLGCFFAMALGGCADVGALQQTVADTRTEIAQLKAQATTMPSDSPDRKVILDNAGKADAALAKAQAALDAIKAAQNGDDSSLLKALSDSGIPYASLAGALGLFAWREIKAAQVRKALNQTVTAIDAANPNGPPEPLKQALSTAQDVSTKKLVAQIKASS